MRRHVLPKQRILRENLFADCARILLPENAVRIELVPVQVDVLAKCLATIWHGAFVSFLAGVRALVPAPAGRTRELARTTVALIDSLARMSIQVLLEQSERSELLAAIMANLHLIEAVMVGKSDCGEDFLAFLAFPPIVAGIWMLLEVRLQPLNRIEVFVARFHAARVAGHAVVLLQMGDEHTAQFE